MLLQFVQTTYIPFRWGFDIFFNVLPSPIYVLAIVSFSKAANLFQILIWYSFLTSRLLFPEIKSFHITRLCCLFTYCQSFPNFCNRQIVISIKSQLPWYIVHPVYSNAISCLPMCVQSGCESSRQERSRSIYECFGARTSCSLTTLYIKIHVTIILPLV